MKRRDFLATSALALLGAANRRLAAAPELASLQAAAGTSAREPVIGIHQHLGYSGRPDDALIAHQRAIGAAKTILLPAGGVTLSLATWRLSR